MSNLTYNQKYFEDFEILSKSLKSTERSWLTQRRHKAMELFMEQGFPSVKNEEWRYLRLNELMATPFEHPTHPIAVDEEELKSHFLENHRGPRLVFINGFLSKKLSQIDSLPRGVILQDLNEAIRNDLVPDELLINDPDHTDPFTALNTAFMNRGLFLCVSEGTILDEPLHLVYYSASNGSNPVTYPRNLIMAKSNSEATIIESYASVPKSIYFTNAVTTINLNKKARIQHYKVQDESRSAFHIANLNVHQEDSSLFESHVISLGSHVSRNNLHSKLDAPGCECITNGLLMIKGSQQADQHTRIDHLKPQGTSKTVFKGILDEKSRGVFDGKVIVHPGAQKTDAQQTNKNLLLSKDAEMNPKPQLEIYADDVKCSHGATVGQLDEDSLFYLRSRGINKNEAEHILTYAFASSLLESLDYKPFLEHVKRKLSSAFNLKPHQGET